MQSEVYGTFLSPHKPAYGPASFGNASALNLQCIPNLDPKLKQIQSTTNIHHSIKCHHDKRHDRSADERLARLANHQWRCCHMQSSRPIPCSYLPEQVQGWQTRGYIRASFSAVHTDVDSVDIENSIDLLVIAFRGSFYRGPRCGTSRY